MAKHTANNFTGTYVPNCFADNMFEVNIAGNGPVHIAAPVFAEEGQGLTLKISNVTADTALTFDPVWDEGLGGFDGNQGPTAIGRWRSPSGEFNSIARVYIYDQGRPYRVSIFQPKA